MVTGNIGCRAFGFFGLGLVRLHQCEIGLAGKGLFVLAGRYFTVGYCNPAALCLLPHGRHVEPLWSR